MKPLKGTENWPSTKFQSLPDCQRLSIFEAMQLYRQKIVSKEGTLTTIRMFASQFVECNPADGKQINNIQEEIFDYLNK